MHIDKIWKYRVQKQLEIFIIARKNINYSIYDLNCCQHHTNLSVSTSISAPHSLQLELRFLFCLYLLLMLHCRANSNVVPLDRCRFSYLKAEMSCKCQDTADMNRNVFLRGLLNMHFVNLDSQAFMVLAKGVSTVFWTPCV